MPSRPPALNPTYPLPDGFSTFFKADFGPIFSKLKELESKINEGLKAAAKGKPVGASVDFTSLTGGRTRSFACCTDCTAPKPSSRGWEQSEYSLGASASATGVIGFCSNDTCKFIRVVPLTPIRISVGVAEAPSIELKLLGGGSGGGTFIDQCPADSCGFVKGNITLSGAIKAGAKVEAKAELFDGDKEGCPPGMTPKAAKTIDACWGTSVGGTANGFSSLTSSKLASVDGELKFALPGAQCLNSGGSCSFTALEAAAVFEWKFAGGIGPFTFGFGDSATIPLFDGFSGSCF